MSAFGTYPTRVIVQPDQGYINDTSPQQYGLIPISPYYYINNEYFIEKDRSHERRNAYRRYPTAKRTSEYNEYDKPGISYVEIIAKVILESPNKRLVLGDIYERILQMYPYFQSKGSGWRNSIRHNLSLSDCFHKGERSANGKGHFWEVNMRCYEDTMNGKARNYSRRKSMNKTKPGNSYESLYREKETILLNTTEQKLVELFELASKKINRLDTTLNEVNLVR